MSWAAVADVRHATCSRRSSRWRVPTSSAASPTGKLPGSRMPAKKPMRMMARTGKAIQAASHICAAGRIEMKAIEMPASVPSSAARGVYRRMYGPTNAPIRTITPMMKPTRGPASQAWTGSFGGQVDRQHDHEDDDEHVRDARPVGHRRRRRCGSRGGPAGGRGRRRRRCRRAARCRARAGSRRRRRPSGSARRTRHSDGEHEDVDQDVEAEAEEGVEVAARPQRRSSARDRAEVSAVGLGHGS